MTFWTGQKSHISSCPLVIWSEPSATKNIINSSANKFSSQEFHYITTKVTNAGCYPYKYIEVHVHGSIFYSLVFTISLLILLEYFLHGNLLLVCVLFFGVCYFMRHAVTLCQFSLELIELSMALIHILPGLRIQA